MSVRVTRPKRVVSRTTGAGGAKPALGIGTTSKTVTSSVSPRLRRGRKRIETWAGRLQGAARLWISHPDSAPACIAPE